MDPRDKNAASCGWAAPTLYLSPPYWLEAWDSPWTCVRDQEPRVLPTTEACSACPRWQPRDSQKPPASTT